MVQHPLFGEVSKNFNETAALEAYEAFQSDPEYYHVLLQMHAHDVVSEVKYSHPEVIDELITKKFEVRKKMVKDAILSGVINKSMSGGTVDEIVATMDKIQKDVAGYTEWERAANTKEQRRDVRGRFVPMGRTVIQQPVARNNRAHEWDSITASYDKIYEQKNPGKPRPPTIRNARRELNAKHSAAYLQVADALKGIDPGGLVMGDVTWEERDRQGRRTNSGTDVKVGSTVEDFVTESDYGSGKTITNINWYMDMDSASGGGFDLLTGAGVPADAYIAGAGIARRAGDQARLRPPGLEYGTPGTAGYSKLSNTANMIDVIGGDALSGKAKWALGAAKYVGDYGSEAEKVLGPTARRATYRYRGTERKPDEKMDTAIAMSVRGAKDVTDAHEQLIHPKVVVEQNGLDFEDKDEHSPFIKYWQNQLPKREHLNLHLDSGTTPPSQGVVFDAKGQIISQSVGYGDDHYLPFNLRKLSGANRGEWVRTRTMGGPTTEDIYAGLITGARSITVVSHSGVYNVEFDESFRGGRRANDKSARMVRRYAQLLDTLDAESTSLQKIPPDRDEEIRAKVAAEIPGSGKDAEAARTRRLIELRAVEKQNPVASKAQHMLWTAEYGQRLAENMADNQGRDDLTWDGVKANLRIRLQSEADAEHEKAVESIPAWGQAPAARKTIPVLTDEDAIERLGLTESYTNFIKGKESEYRTSQQPLKLNGQGYYFALQALQEQFPYAIKRVEWYPTDDVKSKDTGYVPHKFNRPKAAKEGFWNPEIEGISAQQYETVGKPITTIKGKDTGKIAAHHTNYQNYAARQRAGASAAANATNERRPANDDEEIDRARVGGATNAALGVTLTNITPDTGANDVLRARRRRIGIKAAREFGNLRIGIQESANDPLRTIPLKSAGIGGLNTLTRLNDVDLSDPNVQDALADDIEGLVRGTAAISVVGGLPTLIVQIKSSSNGSELLERYAEEMRSVSVKNPTTVEELVSDDPGVWNFGSDFLPGGSKDADSYRRTLATDGDIQSVRDSFLTSGVDWKTYRDSRIKEIKTVNESVADASVGAYEGKTIVYNGRDYNVPGGLNELTTLLARESTGLAKTKQLMDLLKITDDPFGGPPSPQAVEAPKTPVSEAPKELPKTPQKPAITDKVQPKVDDDPRLMIVNQVGDRLHAMVGMSKVADQYDELVAESVYNQRRAAAGLQPADMNHHLVFVGPPGTGKTTVARDFATAYYALGIVPENKFTDVNAGDMIGAYANQIPDNVHRQFQKAKGGVLFIDEAYIFNKSQYGREAMAQMMKEIEDNRNDTVVIVAGYEDEMNDLKGSNKGFASRFPRTITFPGYNEKELRKIMGGMLKEKGYVGAPGFNKKLDEMAAYISATPNHGQGREARNAVDAIVREHARRSKKFPKARLDRLVPSDVDNAMKKWTPTTVSGG